jgi:hypothetical protein
MAHCEVAGLAKPRADPRFFRGHSHAHGGVSTTVFLELSIGNLYAAIAVSLLMVGAAVVVLVLARVFGLRGTGMI